MRIRIVWMAGAALIAGCSVLNIPSYPTEPVSATEFAVVHLMVRHENVGMHKTELLGGLITSGDDQFESITAVLGQQDPETCNNIDVPLLQITPEAPTASGRVNAGDLMRFQIYHTTEGGLRGETPWGYFIPEPGAEYVIVDQYDGANTSEFRILLLEQKRENGEVQVRPLDIYAKRPFFEQLSERCYGSGAT